MEGDVCAGCLRTLDEIARWSQMSDTEKQHVLARVEQRKTAAGTADVHQDKHGGTAGNTA